MKTRELHINDPLAIPAVIDELKKELPRVMFQMPSVQTLLAPATSRGIEALNSAKNRLPAKNYGSAIGSLENFHAMAEPEFLPQEFNRPEALRALEGAFIRLRCAPAGFNSDVMRSGTHQGLLLPPSPHRTLLTEVELALRPMSEPELFNGKIYSSVLCTSANLSGDPLGSITDEIRAAEFVSAQQIGLWIRCEPVRGETGSYPIFSFDGNNCEIGRDGPGRQDIQRRLPASIRYVNRA